MASSPSFFFFFFLLLLLPLLPPPPPLAEAVGVCWSTDSAFPLPPDKVVDNLLKPNHVHHLRLFDADPVVLQSLEGTGIGVGVGVPNEILSELNSSMKAAKGWVHDNVTRYFSTVSGGNPGVRIEYIFIGDDPFLQSYGHQFEPFVVGAAANIQLALTKMKLADKVKVVVPCSSDVYQPNASSLIPSKSEFRPDINKTMTELLSFLAKHRSPFVISVNPFLTLQRDKNFTMQHALFDSTSHPIIDGHNKYHNIFDASIDALVTSLAKAGYGNMDIIVGKVGWPTDGAENASIPIAQRFMKGLVDHLLGGTGTPLRPKEPLKRTYIFSLLDEDQRSVDNGNDFERHWGVFTFDGQAKYNVDLGQGWKDLVNARNVDYLTLRWCVLENNNDTPNASAAALDACSKADCSALSLGGSCSTIGWPGNVSYALNSYYQRHNQRADSCDFGGLGLITIVDPSVGECRFRVGLRMSASTHPQNPMIVLRNVVLGVLIFLGCIW